MLRSRNPDPTPEEIRAMTAAIRAGWDEHQWNRARGLPPDDDRRYMIPQQVRSQPAGYPSRGSDVRAFL